jgi:DMSO/TMAO reductase YedYZ molybdopterin-dependent catalytic subunit
MVFEEREWFGNRRALEGSAQVARGLVRRSGQLRFSRGATGRPIESSPMADPNSKDRRPPGQYLTRDLPVMQIGTIPHADPETWSLRITGLVQSPADFTLSEFRNLPMQTVLSDMHCVSTWSIYDLAWRGVPVRDLLERARPQPGAGFVLVHADGGYTTNLPLDAILADDVLVATELNGDPLPREHGGPARLVVPHLYAYKSAKWVRTLEIVAEDRPGFWESRGYSNSADPWAEERFAPAPTEK